MTKNDGDKKSFGDNKDNPHLAATTEQATNGITYLFVHPAYPVTRIYYFPAIVGYTISELALTFFPSFNQQTSLSRANGNFYENDDYSNQFNYLPAFLLTSLFLFALVGNMAVGRAPDRESRYDPPSDKVALSFNFAWKGVASGASALLSYGKNFGFGFGGAVTNAGSEVAAASIAVAEHLTNERILDNHSHDRSPNQDGYMRALDYFGDRGERLITRVAEIVASYLYRYADSGFAARVHLNDANRAAFRAGVTYGERVVVDLLVTFMNDLLYYAQSVADIYLISSILQFLRIADSSGSASGTWKAFDPTKNSPTQKIVDDTIKEAKNLGGKFVNGANELGKEIAEGFEEVGGEIANGVAVIGRGFSNAIHNLGNGLPHIQGQRDNGAQAIQVTYQEAATQTEPEPQGVLTWLYTFLFGRGTLSTPSAAAEEHHHNFQHFLSLFAHHNMIIEPHPDNLNLFTLPGGREIEITRDHISFLNPQLTVELTNPDGIFIESGGLRFGPITSNNLSGMNSITPGHVITLTGSNQIIAISQTTNTQAHQANFCARFSEHARDLGDISIGQNQHIDVHSYVNRINNHIVIVVGDLQIELSGIEAPQNHDHY